VAAGSIVGIQQFLRSQGIEWGDSAGHDYHLWFDGDKLYTDAQFVFGGPSPWVDVTRFGADPSGTVDSLAALNAAAQSLPTISGSRTGTLFLPAGIYRLSNTFNQPSHVVVKGHGLGTRIYPTLTGFPATTPLWRLGDSQQSLATGCRLEDVWLDCQSIAADGLVTNQAQEMSGARNLTITNYTRYGIHYQNGAVHCDFSDLWVYCSASATNSIGFYGDLFGGSFSIRNATFTTSGGAAVQTAGIQLVGVSAINGGHVLLERIHAENAVHGIQFGTSAYGTVIGADGLSDIVNLITINSGAGPVVCIGIEANGATHTINDLQQVVVDDSQIQPLWISTYPGATVNPGLAIGGRLLTPSIFFPTAVAGANAGASPPAPVVVGNAHDQDGTITWGTGTGAAAGLMVAVTFSTPFTSGVTVQLTANNAATATLLPFAANMAGSGFSIAVVGIPASSQANTVYSVNYHVEARK
jgi:hypothetical protein